MSRYQDAVEQGYDGPSPYEVARARMLSRDFDCQEEDEPEKPTLCWWCDGDMEEEPTVINFKPCHPACAKEFSKSISEYAKVAI